ncbi:hypothetical protein PGB90_007431 [Kerria lacca]
MVLTKQYLRYVPSSKLNIICSSDCNISCVKLNEKFGRYVATGGAEDVLIWDIKLGKKVQIIEGEKYKCVYLKSCPQRQKLAVGYQNGTIILYDIITGENISTFVGHNSSITALDFDFEGYRIASGSKDTDIAVWDIVGEQGLCRLSGHKGPITQIKFMKTLNIIISSSKDTYIKFWDLSTGYCFKTLTGHLAEVWDFCLMKNDSFLVTGTNDNELRVWRIKDSIHNNQNNEVDFENRIVCEKAGSLLRQSIGRVVSMSSDDSSQVLCCYGTEKILEIFYFVSEEETIYRHKKRQKKIKKKLLETNSMDMNEDILPPTSLVFAVTRLPAIKTSAKIKSIDVLFESGTRIKIFVSLNNNSIQLHTLVMKCEKCKNNEFKKKCQECELKKNHEKSELKKIITSSGHTADVRSIAFGEDNVNIVSGSSTGIKIWNNNTSACVCSININHVVTVCFVPGDRYVLAGLQNGSLIIIDISYGEIIEIIDTAHSKEIWRISILPNKNGCITCSSDCTVKLWNFELIKNKNMSVLSVLHVRTLKLEESVLDVRVTPDCNLITAALLDCTVQIFFMDSLKFFLNLHSHKLPVTCLDISYDSTLIVTGSTDCSVKIWGLDYGDCHRSVLAHKLAVTSLCFVSKTHHFFSCGKDGLIHQWDADNYERILTLQGHFGETWCLSVSPNGIYVASCGQDRVIRIYEKSDEPLVLEDEREAERQEEEEKTLITGEQSLVLGRVQTVSKKTVKAEKGAELLLECLDIIKEYKKCQSQSKDIPLPAIMLAFNVKTTDEYLVLILRKLRSSDLEEILSLLPFLSVNELIEYLVPLLRRQNSDTEIIVRILVFLLRAHHKPIISSNNLYITLKQLNLIAIQNINEITDTMGYNLHALYYTERINT